MLWRFSNHSDEIYPPQDERNPEVRYQRRPPTLMEYLVLAGVVFLIVVAIVLVLGPGVMHLVHS